MRNAIAVLLLCAGWLAAEVPSAVAIRNAKVVTVSGPAIPRGTVVLRNGLIEAVGENVPVPADAWVIDGEGLTVYPGLMDALSTWGLPDQAPAAAAGRRPGTPAPAQQAQAPQPPPARGPEDRPSTTSWLRAADELRTTDRRLETARNAGYTTAATFPTRGIFAGQGAVISLAADRPRDMVIASPAGQYITLTSGGFGRGFPSSLMGVIAYIRQIYVDADYYTKAKAEYASNPRGMARPEYDRALEGVLESPRILLPATRKVEIDRMIHFAAELKQKTILYGGVEGYRAADLLKQGGLPILINLRWPEKPRDADPDQVETLRTLENRDRAPATPGLLVKAGVKFAFYSGGLDRRRDIYRAVRRAIEGGLSFDDAVRAMTLTPAEIYGVSDRLGSVEKGKIANLIVTSGDLFQDRTQIKYIFIDGVKYEPTPETETPEARPTASAQTGDWR